ncbi:MAG: hypothetical protein QUU85_06905 [Candidatus Eisenbacteria bacterium]|nr:hypothetical protein [Candidatus Eisenbacteria bacterium]
MRVTSWAAAAPRYRHVRLAAIMLLLGFVPSGCTVLMPTVASVIEGEKLRKDRLPPDTLRALTTSRTVTFKREGRRQETGLFLGFDTAAAAPDGSAEPGGADSVLLRIDFGTETEKVAMRDLEWVRLRQGWIGVPIAIALGLVTDAIVLTQVIGPLDLGYD